MSHKPGTHLGGIRTLQDLRDRCHIDDDTGCWIWKLALDRGHPKVHFVAPDTGERKCMRGPRAAWYLRGGEDIANGRIVFRLACCPNRDCVNPTHVKEGTMKERGTQIRRSGVLRNLPQSIEAATRVARTHRAKLTLEQVREIRSSPETCAELARRFGIAHSQISAIRRGEAWKDIASNASVFTWRPAA